MTPLLAKSIFPASKTTWNFTDRFIQNLPADPEQKNFRRQVRGAAYSFADPTAAPAPKTVVVSSPMADQLGIDPEDLLDQKFADVFSGSVPLADSRPFAMCYGGHQFGNWAGQLGDGRAINLAEIQDASGQNWTIQLKGAGPTPYSRTADGLAVLRSSVREFLCSEAMYHLGVPTTRALCLVETGLPVERDMFYDGHVKQEPGAVVCRVSPSFIRFGNFQILTANRDFELLKQLANYSIQYEFQGIEVSDSDCYERWFQEICDRTARMVVDWMRVGFVHGVMNTDNMSILGLTIDYGPYGWLEPFEPDWTPNTTDSAHHRYRFGAQMEIAGWNLYQLANAIAPLFSDVEPLKESLQQYHHQVRQYWLDSMRSKLCLTSGRGSEVDLIDELWEEMPNWNVDYCRFFRLLGETPAVEREGSAPELLLGHLLKAVEPSFYGDVKATKEKITPWVNSYLDHVGSVDWVERSGRMNQVNPKYVLRNYLAQIAIDEATKGDYQLVHRLLKVLENPYQDQPGNDDLDRNRPDWARNKPGCSMLSCSS